MLTFYIGALIYALPIPLSGVKRWGPRLLADAVYTMSLTVFFSSIFSFVTNVMKLLGASWNLLFAYISSQVMFKTIAVVVLAQTSYMINKIIPGISALIKLIMSKILFSLYISLLVFSLASIIKNLCILLASIGIALMSIPFRIGRYAGAFLLSFSIVFYVGLPLLPHFIALAISASSSTNNTMLLYGKVISEYGYELGGFIDVVTKDRKIYGPYPVANGSYITLNEKGAPPYSSKITLVYDVCGELYATNVSDVTANTICRHGMFTMCRVNVLVHNVVYYSKGKALVVIPYADKIEVLVFNLSHVVAKIDCKKHWCLVEIRFTRFYSLAWICIDSTCYSGDKLSQFYIDRWEWYGIPGYTYAINISGVHIVQFGFVRSSEECSPEPPLAGAFIGSNISSHNPSRFLESLARSIYAEIFGEILYLSLLLGVSVGLARALGGSYRLKFW